MVAVQTISCRYRFAVGSRHSFAVDVHSGFDWQTIGWHFFQAFILCVDRRTWKSAENGLAPRRMRLPWAVTWAASRRELGGRCETSETISANQPNEQLRFEMWRSTNAFWNNKMFPNRARRYGINSALLIIGIVPAYLLKPPRFIKPNPKSN